MNNGVVRSAVVGLIRLYQYFVSPWLGRCCRFEPTCSHYAAEAIQSHGALRGLMFAVIRMGKCHPFHPGGADPVPSSRWLPGPFFKEASSSGDVPGQQRGAR